jgi:hypothetical protein
MTNMQCSEFERILEQQEGPLPGLAVAHLDGCEACSTLTADLDSIHNAAVELGVDGIAPPEHLWLSLRRQLEEEGIIKEPRRDSPAAERGWWYAFQRPALAGAFLSLAIAAAGLAGFTGNSTQMAVHPQFEFKQNAAAVPSAYSVFQEEQVAMGNEDIPGFQAKDAAVTASFRRNLSIVDNFIAMCEKSVREQPDNEMAREYLYGAYQQKAELLATATNRSTMGGLQ